MFLALVLHNNGDHVCTIKGGANHKISQNHYQTMQLTNKSSIFIIIIFLMWVLVSLSLWVFCCHFWIGIVDSLSGKACFIGTFTFKAKVWSHWHYACTPRNLPLCLWRLTFSSGPILTRKNRTPAINKGQFKIWCCVHVLFLLFGPQV